MSFLAPAAFGLAALIPIIVAMYLLKLRRTEQVVSSVYLWRRMTRDLEANAPWQRLRRNLLLLLQLLFLGFLILALARPFTWAEGASGQGLILILDTSASMAATDVSPSRLGAAKTMAQQLADGQPDDARITLIAASDGAQVLVASSQDRRAIYRALEGMQVGAGGSDLTPALELASAVAARQPDTEIVVLSDGGVKLPDRLALNGQVRYLPVGQNDDNQAISTLALGPAPGGEEMTGFAQVTNYGGTPAQRRLTLYADGQLINAYDLDISPGDQQAVLAHGLPVDIRVLEAQLDGEDALPLDDRAWAVGRNREPASVALVTDGNLFLETGLALLPGLEVTTVRPDDYEEGWQDDRVEDNVASQPAVQPSNLPAIPSPTLTIFDSYVPITATLPAGDLLFIAPVRSTELFSVTGMVDQPTLRAANTDDPLLDYVNLAESNVLDAVQIPLPLWARPVIVADPSPSPGGASDGATAPLLFAGEVDGRRVAVLAFDVRRSDLPLQVAFPLLLANLTGWLAPGGGADLPAGVAPGTAVSFTLPPETTSATVTRPDGSTVRLVPEQGRAVFADIGQLGVYQLDWHAPSVEGDEIDAAHFAVNLFSPQESDVRPVEALPALGAGDAGGEERSGQARREWWRTLALIALALLTAEWLVYQRATLTRLWKSVR